MRAVTLNTLELLIFFEMKREGDTRTEFGHCAAASRSKR